MIEFGLVLLAYLIGSVPFAIVISRAFRLPDPREYGSKNPGATNVLRSGNKLAALITLLGDTAKGYLAVWLTQVFASDITVAAAALAVFLGHLFPLFLRFRGGKGVATSLGAWLALDVLLGSVAIALWLLVALITRISSAGALAAAIVAPLVSAWQSGIGATTIAVAAMATLLVLRHKENIHKLIARSEGKIGAHEDA
jgi:acyl phosphate:glycerol-3-phosphate acyltransferase